MKNHNRPFPTSEIDSSAPQPLPGAAKLASTAARVLLEETQDAVFVLDEQDRVVDLNPAARRLVDDADVSATGQSIGALFDSWPKNLQWPQDDRAITAEIVLAKTQTEVREFALQIWPLKHQDGPVEGHLVVLHEITEWKQMVAERNRAHQATEAAHRDLFSTETRSAEMERLKSNFIANVSHQLRTPVANLHLYLYLLQHGSAERRDHYFTALKDEVAGLEQLVSEILDFAEENQDETRERFGLVDLNLLLEQLLPPYEEEAQARGIAFTFEAGETAIVVRGRLHQLAKAIVHLLDNAVAYTLQGQITVRLFVMEEQKEACLEVQDTGIGIYPEDLPYLFKRFYRGLGVRETDKPGVGLGLSLVKQVMRLHGGNLQVESQVGEGSLFRVQLPIVKSE